ncbi:oxidoreductase [Fructilactobacillus lindneri]|uniref:Glycine D-amino acid oxidase n=1 Tax=Fructilactobacillus lindneri DSM 20690 = JCM 11027 TaxID=1122148 RepID=A0A0R2JPG0_9LACO|nr:FAD-dependent oxidoreductase [Fructilactobacillus lindneri]KRN79010.1 glycine D-amino acid oxidase [Fructilactobacillus lindneri DSM 20690 = JCM 11027]POG98709.1 oxidoreductase [Fructilactobacillus lindneri]POH07661.1 oxidoreductase [Fructilactobacillus lindneri]POH08240.1 oxidoreductase [Fructilactobacillus lindneri]POH08734.1 oxidoreductase [Fructilactobacillus lindneri]
MKKKVAIIGGGIVGSSAAYFLNCLPNNDKIDVTLFDDGQGQATMAAAGIISPWLSKRRNKKWYQLAKDGAKLIAKIAVDTNMNSETYANNGTIITRKNADDLTNLFELAKKRKLEAPQMGSIEILTKEEITKKIPIINKPLYDGLFISGGARIEGGFFCRHLLNIAQKNNLKILKGKTTFQDDHNLEYKHQIYYFDKIIVATGAWAKQTLAPLGIKCKIRAQKGQLIEVKVPSFKNDQKMPVMMPESEFDLIPLGQGKLIIGATHDNEQQFDLNIEKSVTNHLITTAHHFVTGISTNDVIMERVGTRAYTNDYAPFFGTIPGHDSILVGSGLGSSGLTTGPLVGKFLAELVCNEKLNFAHYRKPIGQYIS